MGDVWIHLWPVWMALAGLCANLAVSQWYAYAPDKRTVSNGVALITAAGLALASGVMIVLVAVASLRHVCC